MRGFTTIHHVNSVASNNPDGTIVTGALEPVRNHTGTGQPPTREVDATIEMAGTICHIPIYVSILCIINVIICQNRPSDLDL